MDTIASLTDALLLHLVWTSIQATLLIGLLWLLGRALPRLPASTRCLLWWLLGAQLLVGLAWQAPVALPLLPAQVTATAAATPRVIHVDAQKAPTATPAISALSDASRVNHVPSWREALAVAWLCGLLAQLAFVARQWQRTRRIRRKSKPLHDPRLNASCAYQAQRLGLRHCPQLRMCDAIDSPQVTGLWRPVVLLPTRTTLTSAEQTLAIAHELAHVRRGDLWLGWIPALAKGLFFFHPLVRLAVREYTLHREAACDSQALRLHRTALHTYGQLLLRLGVERPMSVGFAGVASPSCRQMKRRLTLLQHATHAMPRRRDWMLVVVIAFAFLVPYRVVTANGEAHGTRQAASGSAITTRMPSASPPTTANPQNANSNSVIVDTAGHCSVGADNIGFCGAHFLVYARSSTAGQGVVFFDRHRVIIHGTHADVVAAKRFYEPDTSALWFRRGDKAWVTRNDEVIERARRIYAPTLKRMQQSDLFSDAANALTDKQWALTSQQSAFAQKLAAFAQQQADLARKRASLAQERTALAEHGFTLQRDAGGSAANAATRTMVAQRKAIASRQHALDAQQTALDAQQTKLAQQRAALDATVDRERHALAAQRAKLAKQRNALAQHREQDADHVHQAMQQLLDEALAKGVALPASHT